VREEPLRDALWKNPGDEAARRVYIDWLLERGDPRGELFSLLLGERARDLAVIARINRLTRDCRDALLGPAKPYVGRWLIWDVFVSKVTCELSRFADGFEHVAALGPELEVKLWCKSGRRSAVARLAKLPLARIFRLSFDGVGLDDADLATLAPALAGLRELDLRGTRITREGLDRVARQLAGTALEVDL
jgi:uncharacterized protein (TIGR02996 family)